MRERRLQGGFLGGLPGLGDIWPVLGRCQGSSRERQRRYSAPVRTEERGSQGTFMFRALLLSTFCVGGDSKPWCCKGGLELDYEGGTVVAKASVSGQWRSLRTRMSSSDVRMKVTLVATCGFRGGGGAALWCHLCSFNTFYWASTIRLTEF